MQTAPDFGIYCERICRHYWGEPTKQSRAQLRWIERGNDYGGKSYDCGKRVWYDRAQDRGGDAIRLIELEQGLGFVDAWRWGYENGLIDEAPAAEGASSSTRIIATYDYVDEQGALLFQAVRLEPKAFRQRRPVAGGWEWRTKGVRQVPYRLPELLAAIARGAVVFIVEGEKDVDSLLSVAVPATSNAMGAGKWRDELNQFFKGASVIVVQDNDAPGREHALRVFASLELVAANVRILDLTTIWPECPEKGDISDWLADGRHSVGALLLEADRLLREPAKPQYTNGAAPGTAQNTFISPSGIVSSAKFIAGFVPPDYLIDGLIQRRFFYSMTGATGCGKTAVLLFLAAAVALGRQVGGRETAPGRVLYLAGENPDDVRMRWIAMAEQLEFDIATIPVFFRPGVFAIDKLAPAIAAWSGELGGVELVVIDTSAAYFLGVDENSNAQIGAHARTLRGLCTLAGEPTVIAACHPVKRAQADDLLPRGGGAFIAEVDGNLTCALSDNVVSLHWQGKFRGPEFSPLAFGLETVKAAGLVDGKGREIPTVICRSISELEQEKRLAEKERDENLILEILRSNPRESLAAMASRAGWFMQNGKPYAMRVKRVLGELKRDKLAKQKRRKWVITEEGEKALNEED
jgi:hypothetical protein